MRFLMVNKPAEKKENQTNNLICVMFGCNPCTYCPIRSCGYCKNIVVLIN